MESEPASGGLARRLKELHHIAKVPGWAAIDQGVVSGANFLINIQVARGLGVYQFGIFTLTWSAVLFAAAMQYALISSPMYSMAPRQNSGQQPSYFGNLLVQETVFACFIMLLYFVGVHAGAFLFKNWQFASLALALAAAAGGYLWQEFIRRCLFARQRLGAALLSDAVSYLGRIALLFVAFRKGSGLEGVLWISALTSALGGLVGLGFIGSLEWKAERLRPIVTQHWRFSRWLVGSVLMQYCYNNAFMLVAGFLLGAQAVGGMRAASLVLAVNNVLFLGQENFLPMLAAETFHKHGIAAFKSFMRRWTLFGMGITLFISLVAISAPTFWIALFFGHGMAVYGDLVYVYAVGFPLIYMCMIAGVVLRTTDATRIIFRADTVTAALCLLSAFPLIEAFGVWGAVIGPVACQAAGLAVMQWGIRQRFEKYPSLT